MNRATASLFLSGVFFGGALDHVILALRGATETHYGVAAGVAGNWAFAAFDMAVTVGLFLLHRRFARHAASDRESRSAGPPSNAVST